MDFYLFYVRDPQGVATTFQALEIADDAAAVGKAQELLRDHPSCASVEVLAGERQVVFRQRDQPLLRSAEGPGDVACP